MNGNEPSTAAEALASADSAARSFSTRSRHRTNKSLANLASLARFFGVAKNWQLQEAKNQFSTVVERALTDGYQVVTRHGRPAVVVMSMEEFRRLNPRRQSLVDFLADSPLRALEELPKRRRDAPRKVSL